jgi:hypothetical protein
MLEAAEPELVKPPCCYLLASEAPTTSIGFDSLSYLWHPMVQACSTGR